MGKGRIKMNRRTILALVVVVIATSVSGCGAKPNNAGEKIVARINNYELTSSDFNDELRLTAANKYLSSDPAKAREELLDEIITKKLLLQEAQRRDFDKDKAFMKEIERYWEQALIKLLVRSKMDELSRSVTVDEREITEEYDRLAAESGGRIGPKEAMASVIKDDMYQQKMERLFNEWLERMRSASDVKIYKENL